jgi:hypothetical protein
MSFIDLFFSGFRDFIFLNYFGHLLFLIALCGVYTLASWRKALSFVLFFIAGYLITYFLKVFEVFTIARGVLTILLPVTVIVTAFTNFFVKKMVFTNRYPSQNFRFYFAVAAGIIHGFAFKVPDTGIVPVIAYNSGIIFCIFFTYFALLTIALVLTYFLRVRLREWNLIISGACAGIALYKILMINL